MNYSAYIQRQKIKIRERHEGEVYLVCGDSVTLIRPTEEILKEMAGLKGLNKEERGEPITRKAV